MIGARLKQARLLAGMTLTQLASEMSENDYRITKQAISNYEREKSFPSAQFLLLASSVLGVRSTYLSHVPEATVEWGRFRCRKRLSQRERNRIKAYASDVAELQTELRELFYPNSEPELPSIMAATLEDAEDAAAQLREVWDVGDRPLDNLVQTAEDREIVVIGWHDETGLFDGLSGKCAERPVTVISSGVTTDRQRLTLAHEIGHLTMTVGNIDEDEEEKLAYRFASALLVPEVHAKRELGSTRRRLDWGELQALKRKYGMSMSAWVRRAFDLNIIVHSTYVDMNIDYKRRGWHRGEPVTYLGDEEPLQLGQMIQRAVAEGLVSPDRMTRIGVDVWEPEPEPAETEHLTVYDLLAMPEDERKAVMDRAFELAADYDFEIFESDEFYEAEDFND